MPNWLFDLSSTQVLLLFIAVFVGGTCLGTVTVQPLLRRWIAPQPDWNALVTGVLSCFVVFYGLLLGLLAVAAHERRTSVENIVSREALSLAGIYGEVNVIYPEDLRHELHELLRQYVDATIREDWPQQQRGELPWAGTRIMQKINARLWSFDPPDQRAQIVHAELLDQLSVPRDLRRERLYAIHSGLPNLLWYVVWIGAVLTIVFIYLFDLQRRNALLLAGLLSFFIAFLTGVIAVLDRPLLGPRAVAPQSFEMLRTEVMSRPTARNADAQGKPTSNSQSP
ncbi:MAG: hypothetical protein ACKO3P_19595 [Planctomycetaceae bacterium]